MFHIFISLAACCILTYSIDSVIEIQTYIISAFPKIHVYTEAVEKVQSRPSCAAKEENLEMLTLSCEFITEGSLSLFHLT